MKKIILITFFFSSVALSQNPQWIIYDTTNSQIPSNTVTDIVIDNFNRKWVAFWNIGLLLIDGDNWTLFNTTNSSIPSNLVGSLLIDHNQNLWLGAYDESDGFRLAKFDGVNWTIWSIASTPLPGNYIHSMIVDDENDIWLLNMDLPPAYSTHYLYEFVDETNWIQHATFEAFVGKRKLLIDKDQTIWIGDRYGLYKFDHDTLNFILNPFSLSNEIYVTDIKQDFAWNIWYTTGEAQWGWLFKYDFSNFHKYTFKVISIEIDSIGNVWGGTIEYGMPPNTIPAMLIKYNGSDWTVFDPTNSLLPPTFRINDLAFDIYDNLWICTEDKGLVIFNENGITPVELQSFTAEVLEGTVQLNWTTSTETNNSGFELLRFAQNDNVWNKLGFVPGQGTTTEPQFYSFTDEAVEPGTYQYRLKQIDFDGSFEYTNIVEVTVEGPTEFSLSQNCPNPFNPSTKIKFEIPGQARNDNALVLLKVYDLLGKEVATLVNEEKPAGEYEVEFNGANLPSGIYFYQLKTGQYSETKKMVLLK